MEQAQREELAEKRRRFDALRDDPKAKDFCAYWQKEGETANELAKKLKAVISGATPATEEVIIECRAATLRLNQIAHVLSELSCYLGGNNDVISAAMEIVSKHQDMARDSAKNVRMMVEWTVIPGVPPSREEG